MKYPKITIVTPTYNTVETVEQTIQNILDQNYPNLEYIVIDGASTDGTVDVLNKHKDIFTKFVSEPDKGIYDAMNKGISFATGEWIIFMNAQDRFFEKDTLIKAAQYLTDNVDVVYGGFQFNHVYDVSEYRPPVATTELWKGMNICHQAIITRTSLLKEYPYSMKYKIVADYDAIMHQLHVQKARFLKIDFPVAILSGGGLSDKKRIKSLQEQVTVAEKFDKSLLHMLWRRLNLANRAFRVFVRNLLPTSFVKRYLEVTRTKKHSSK